MGPIRAGPDGCVDEQCGRMLKAAPVSTKKRLLDNCYVDQLAWGDGVDKPSDT